MNSLGFPDGDEVLDDLGQQTVEAFLSAVDGARADYEEFRAAHPGWLGMMSKRCAANLIHDRAWAWLVRSVDGAPGIRVIDQEPTRQILVGERYVVRVKRHDPRDRIATYPTHAAVAFWSNGRPALPGLDSYSLALGYRWDSDLRHVGPAVLSFRDGTDNPIWAMELQRNEAVPTGFSWTPVAPGLPELDLSGVTTGMEEETGS
ncbi:MAG: hypothetical protein LBJ44_10180 [Propionibacteriaceae bacterium]|jgi:hypothetical protein|nr:hypothetical protein [Propionibacteriaceae bacterium]